jgi:hypothetical protein
MTLPFTRTERTHDLERIAREYLACFGVLLNVGVFPTSSDTTDLNRFPHIVDFEPKLRDLYQAATETGEVLTGSIGKVSTAKGFQSTESTQTSWKGNANVSVPLGTAPGSPTAGLNAETGQVRTDSDQQNWNVASEASRERRETQSTTTQLSQMYNLLTGYHSGTNNAVFLMLAYRNGTVVTDIRAGLQVAHGLSSAASNTKLDRLQHAELRRRDARNGDECDRCDREEQ